MHTYLHTYVRRYQAFVPKLLGALASAVTAEEESKIKKNSRRGVIEEQTKQANNNSKMNQKRMETFFLIIKYHTRAYIHTCVHTYLPARMRCWTISCHKKKSVFHHRRCIRANVHTNIPDKQEQQQEYTNFCSSSSIACTHICIHTFTHKYIHTNIHAHIHTYINAYIHTYIHTYIRTYIHTHIHAGIQTYLHTCLHAHT